MYREINEKIKSELLKDDKVVVLLGPRQVGKTTLLKNQFPEATYINLELGNYIDIFNTRELSKINKVLNLGTDSNTKEVLILDEVQRLDDPGLVAKVIHDELKNVKLIISGSSALEIAHKASESLAGRKRSYLLYPLSFKEKLSQENKLSSNQSINITEEIKEAMLYGFYPELLNINSRSDKKEYLKELVDSVIMKDIYYLNLVKNTKNIISLLTLLAYQIGQQINVTELSSRIGIARATVEDYLSILKKTFIIFTLAPYTKKRRDEISKMEKVYFYDLGLRNALINDFSLPEYRRDYGNLFENFVITEFIKQNSYNDLDKKFYYWRTKWGTEVDLVATKDDKLEAIEIKTRKGKITASFKNTYPEATERVITMENASKYLL